MNAQSHAPESTRSCYTATAGKLGRALVHVSASLAMLAFASSAFAADITANIVVDTTTESYSLSGSDELSGSASTQNNGTLLLNLFDTATATGTLTSGNYNGGHIILNAYDNSHIYGNYVAQNGGDSTLSLFNNAIFSGNITGSNSGGDFVLNLYDNAEILGIISAGSSSLTQITLQNASKISGGLTATSGGTVNLQLQGTSSLSGNVSSEAGSQLNIFGQDNSVIDTDLTARGSSTLQMLLTDNARLDGNMTAEGSGHYTFQLYENAQVRGGMSVAGGSSADATLHGISKWYGDIVNSADVEVTMNDSSSMIGNHYTNAGATTGMQLNGSSTFTGASVGTWGTINMSLESPTASWYVTQAPQVSQMNLSNQQYASAVSSLYLAPGAWVYLGARNYTMNGAQDRVQLDIVNLTGSGNFELRPYVNGIGTSATNVGDLLYVVNNSSSHNLFIPAAQLGLGGVNVNGQEALKVVHSLDGGGSYRLYNTSYVDIGQYQYKLQQIGTHWYLVAGDPIDNGGNGNGGGNGGNGNGDGSQGGGGQGGGGGLDITTPDIGLIAATPTFLNSTAQATVDFMSTNYLINFLEMQTLVERMGDLRHTRKTDLWFRGFGGRLSSFEMQDLGGYKLDYWGVQVGIDGRVSAISDNLVVGAMFGYTDAEPNHDFDNDTKTESFHAALYALWGNEDDFYIDTILKLSHIRDRFDIFDSQGANVTGKGSSNAYSASVEMGQRFYLSDTREGAYLEPQVQGVYTHQEGVNFEASNGLHTRMDGYDSWLLRGSLLLGYQSKGNIPFDVYFKAGYIRELEGVVDVHFNDYYHDSYSFRGGWWDYGIGFDVEVAERHSFYLEAAYSDGNKFDNKRISGGYRYAF